MSFVYCVSLPSWVTPQLVKIGYSSRTQRRVAQLNAGGPFRLTLAFEAPGTRDTEAALHRIFSEYRAYGEWFDRPCQLEHVFHLLNGPQPEDAFDTRPAVDQLRSWMIRTNTSRAQLALACGVGEATLAKVLKGKTQPSFRHGLCRATDGVVSYYDWDDSPYGRYYSYPSSTRELITEHEARAKEPDRYPGAIMIDNPRRFPVDDQAKRAA